MSTSYSYGDPTNTGSPFRGIIPTIINSNAVAQRYRNQVYIVGRSKVNANVINSLPSTEQPALVPSSPFSTGNNGLASDMYIYFHLVYEAMAANNVPPSTTVTPGPPRLAFLSLENTGTNFTPIPFILATSGNPVTPGNIQPFTLSPIGLTNPNPIPNLSYIAQENPPVYNTSAYEVSNQPKAAIYLSPQGTDSVTIYKDDGSGIISTPITTSGINAFSLEPQNAYTGVWYKTYNNPVSAQTQTPNTSNLWHVFNPFKNQNGTQLEVGTLNSSEFQVSPFTGGGQVLPVYTVGDPAPPLNYQQSPTATLIVNNNTPPYTLDQLTAMTADINDVGNVMSNWGLNEMEIMFLPYQATTFYSGGTSPAFGCYTNVPTSSVEQFQNFVTTPYNETLTYTDPATGNIVTTRGCTDNENQGWLNTKLLGGTMYEFNNCNLMDSNQCNTTNSGASGYWYPYCTGSQTCGTNNCFGTCPSISGNYVPCVRDYAFTESNTNGTTFYSCNPISPVPPNNTTNWPLIIAIIIISVIVVILLVILFIYFARRSNEETVETAYPNPVIVTTTT